MNNRKLFAFIPLALFILLGVFLWIGLSLDPRELPSKLAEEQRPVPAFQLPSLTEPNRILTPDDLKGEVALLNVWATWCPTCKEEHGFLNRLARDEGVTIYGINYKDEPGKAREWLRRYLNPYALVILDEQGSLGLDMGVYGAPETYVLDTQGAVRYRHVGAVDAEVWKTLKQVMVQVEQESAQ
ncbi:cytochrome c biogenesis protein CcmG/thiol:disulfide interchange protein DsbE [Marinobacterium halophilum]|uniref:Cytochrome c biogenesis protein CcmG/thiol:disulfide interchange protein DsbE n=1 Tax=Marinobacterium halophilum TaxID=267374 RepID=A0A2P8ESH9_9GAMM|nr:DsbE family thiol:disulfide interchange protein [Marinobacterium halophilum]PSL12395.1 cytochrome c biogenesis protein CcmG/thiol:disulfide interchange protein DsbE [Marinobacterium halophilum]